MRLSQFAYYLSDFLLIQPFRKDGKNTCEANILIFAIIPVNLIAYALCLFPHHIYI